MWVQHEPWSEFLQGSHRTLVKGQLDGTEGVLAVAAVAHRIYPYAEAEFFEFRGRASGAVGIQFFATKLRPEQPRALL